MDYKHPDLIYAELPKNATDVEKLSIFLKVLHNDSPSFILFNKLDIQPKSLPAFRAKLVNTRLVDEVRSENSTGMAYKLNPNGYIILEQFGSYINYLNSLHRQQEEKENEERIDKELTRQKLWYDHEDAKQRYEDYHKVKRQKNVAYIATVISLLITLAALIIAYKQYLKCK